MKLLLVEDDDLKVQKLSQYLTDAWSDVRIDLAHSVNAGMRAIRASKYDIILLDMSLPTYTITAEEAGGRPQPFGGKEILKYMDRMNVESAVLVVTQLQSFGDGDDSIDTTTLDSQLRHEHPHTYNGLIRYDSGSDSWQEELRKWLPKVCPSLSCHSL